MPSCFLMLSNTTVLAGMFTPIAKVSVAKSTCKGRVDVTHLVSRGGASVTWDTPTTHFDEPS